MINPYDEDQDLWIFGDDESVLSVTKKGKPRKRKPKEPRIYFTQDTEDAIVEYLKSDDQQKRNEIYNTRIQYGFYKLAENIIHTFKFYYTDTDTIEELKHEVITFLFEKLHLYDPAKGKAFSYFGTIVKRYLIAYNDRNYKKLQDKVTIDEVDEENSPILIDKESNLEELSIFLKMFIKYMDKHLDKHFPKKQDSKTADAVIELFRKSDSIEIYNKKLIYIYIREMVDVSTPQITKVIKKLDDIRHKLFNQYYDHGYISI